MEGRRKGKHEVLAPNIQLCKHAECVGDPCGFGCHSDCLKALTKTHQIKKSTDRRKRRYLNSNSICTLCHEEIPLLQQNHLMQHCRGLKSTPVLFDCHKDLRSFSKRCLEIADKRLETATGLHTTPSRTATRIPQLQFGARAGESLSEVAPRRKRLRLNNQTNLTQ